MFLLENKKLKEQLSDVEGKYSIAQEDFENTVKQYENIKVEYDAFRHISKNWKRRLRLPEIRLRMRV